MILMLLSFQDEQEAYELNKLKGTVISLFPFVGVEGDCPAVAPGLR